jgi:hypothetical protein
MKSNLKIFYIPHHSDAWYRFRTTGITAEDAAMFKCDQFEGGIGGSEIGTVLSINKYSTPAKLFHEKVGTIQVAREDNQRMLWGRVLEEQIAKMWTYWDGSQDGYVENFNNNKIVRTCRNVNGYIWNPKYTWLFVSIDRLINIKDGFNLITGEKLTNEGILECKNMGYWANKMWEDGIPATYLAQITEQMIVLETDYVEVPMLIDGGRFHVEKFMLDEELAQQILRISKEFWYNRVLPGREAFRNRLHHEASGNIMEIEKYQGIIDSLEPEPDESEAYADFMEERFVKERELTIGTMAQFERAKKYRFLMNMRTHIEKVMQGIKNGFIKEFTERNTEAFDFGSMGYVNWSERKRAKSRTFNNKIKEKPTDEQVEEQFNKMDLEY